MEPLKYLATDAGRIWLIACLPLGVLLTAAAFWIINHIPAAWLCDYDETPSPELLSGKRIRFLPAGVPLIIVSTACLALCRIEFNKGFDMYFLLLSLIILDCLIIAVADWKYQIIPDQFTIALGILALGLSVYDLVRGFRVFHMAWWSPLAGAAIGAAVMILINYIGVLVYHKEGMGFGDVKLFFAAGILTGFPGTIYIFLISVLTATVCFVSFILYSRISSETEEENEVPETEAAEGASLEGPEAAAENEQPSEEAAQKEQPAESEETKSAGSDEGSEANEADAAPEDGQPGDTEAAEDDKEEPAGMGSYLAFGPYIALGVVVYVILYDAIHSWVQMYLNLL